MLVVKHILEGSKVVEVKSLLCAECAKIPLRRIRLHDKFHAEGPQLLQTHHYYGNVMDMVTQCLERVQKYSDRGFSVVGSFQSQKLLLDSNFDLPLWSDYFYLSKRVPVKHPMYPFRVPEMRRVRFVPHAKQTRSVLGNTKQMILLNLNRIVHCHSIGNHGCVLQFSMFDRCTLG